MTPDEIRTIVLRCIRRVAPEAAPDEIDESASLRDQLDIDSMDFLNIVIGIDKELGIEIPEEDYAKVTTLEDLVTYLHKATPHREGSAKSA